MAHDLSCHRTQKLLALLPGNDLPPELDQPVRDHLAGCQACQRQLGDHLRVRSALGRLAAPHLAHPHVDGAFFADLKGEILRRVSEDTVQHEARVARVSSRRLTLARWMTAAAMLLLAVYLLPQMLANAPDLPGEGPGGPVSSVRGGAHGYVPSVGLQGQQEVLQELDLDREGFVVLEGRTYRLVPLEPKAWSKPKAVKPKAAESKGNRSR